MPEKISLIDFLTEEEQKQLKALQKEYRPLIQSYTEKLNAMQNDKKDSDSFPAKTPESVKIVELYEQIDNLNYIALHRCFDEFKGQLDNVVKIAIKILASTTRADIETIIEAENSHKEYEIDFFWELLGCVMLQIETVLYYEKNGGQHFKAILEAVHNRYMALLPECNIKETYDKTIEEMLVFEISRKRKNEKKYRQKNSKLQKSSGTEILTEEMQNLLNRPNNDLAVLSIDPYLRAVTQKKNENKVSYGGNLQLQILNKTGNLDAYDKDVFDNSILKAWMENKILKDGRVMFRTYEAVRAITGTTGTPTNKQVEDFYKSLETMRNEKITYLTTEALADFLNIDEEQFADVLPDMKERKISEIDEYFLQSVTIVKKVHSSNGEETDVCIVRPGDLMLNVLKKFPWREVYEKDTQRIMQKNEKGELIPWEATRQHIALKNYIFTWTFKAIRTSAKQRKFSLKLPYNTIFNDLNIDVSHRQTKKRKKNDVKIVFEHLKRCEKIADFNEYTNFDGTDGIEITLFEELC